MLKNSTPYIFLLFILPFLGFSQDAPIGNNLYFDGSTEEVISAGTIDQMRPPVVTLEFWIKPFDISSMTEIIRNQRDEDKWGFGIIKSETGDLDIRLRIYIQGGSDTERLSDPVTLIPNEWNHVAATYDGYKSTIYLQNSNGDNVFITDFEHKNFEEIYYHPTQLTGLRIGEQGGVFRVDEIRVWNKPLEQSQISSMRNFEIGADADGNVALIKDPIEKVNPALDFCGELMLYYKFNESSTSSGYASDSSCNGIEGAYGPGIDDTNIGDKDSGLIYYSITDGEWNIADTWDHVIAPSDPGDVVVVDSTHTVTVTNESFPVRTVYNRGNLVVNENCTISFANINNDSIITNNGTINSLGNFNNYSNGITTLTAGSATNIIDTLNNQGIFTIKSNAGGTGSLITEGAISNSGIFNVERWLDPNTSNDSDGESDSKWQLISSPMTNEISNVFLGHHLIYYTESTSDFNYITSTQHSLSVGEGFVARLNGERLANNTTNPITFSQDIPNTGDIVIPLEFGVENTYYGLPAGFNLVGNPYPSNMDWNKIYNLNSEVVDAAYYHYEDANNGNGSWVPYLAGDKTKNDSIINLGQGFGVIYSNTGNNNLILNNNIRVHEFGGGFYKKNHTTNNSFELFAISNKNADNIRLIFNNEATNNYDGQYDAYKFDSFGNTPTPSFISDDGKKLSICQMPTSELINLGFNMNESGEVTFTLHNNKLAFTEIILEDKKEGTFTNLLNSSYIFWHSIDDKDTERFTIYFNKQTLGNTDNLEDLRIYAYENKIFIESPISISDVSIKLYNISGQEILNKQYFSLKKETIETYIKNGIYILEVESNGEVTKRKIIITDNN